VRRFFKRRRAESRWVHPDTHEIAKLFPTQPPAPGDHVLVDGERCRVLACPVKWDGLTWTIGERGIQVVPDPKAQAPS
jgi:hypothetical protein